jgi:hypothetical protein
MRGQPFRFVDFRGGLNTKAGAYLVSENECRDCQNVVSTVRGAIKKRNGNATFCNTFTGTPPFITSLFGLNVGATVLIAAGGTKLYSISTGGVATDITGVATLTSGLRWSFIAGPASGGQGPLYAMNGTDTPKYWTGAGNIADWTASVGSVPNGQFAVYYKNRVWVAGQTANPSRLFFSDLGDPRSWTATNTVDFDPNDGQTITAIGVLGPYLLVFKQTKTFVVYDTNTGANRMISGNVGCISHRSLAETPAGLMFLSSDQGVFLTNGNTLKQLSDNIKPTIDSLSAAAKNNSAAAFYNNHYFLSVPASGTNRNSITLDYDTTTDSWWKHTNVASQFALWRPGSNSQVELYAAQDVATPIVDKCYVENVFSDNATAFIAYWIGPWLSFKQPYIRKRIRQIHVDGRGTWDVSVGQDFNVGLVQVQQNIFAGYGSSGSLFGGADTFGGGGTFGDPSFEGQTHIYSIGVARSFSVKFQSVDSSDGEIDAYTMAVTPRKS